MQVHSIKADYKGEWKEENSDCGEDEDGFAVVASSDLHQLRILDGELLGSITELSISSKMSFDRHRYLINALALVLKSELPGKIGRCERCGVER